VSQPADRRATYDDLCLVPDHLVAQIIDGERIVLSRPPIGHACTSSMLGADLVGFCGRRPGGPAGPGGWWFLDEPELHLGSDILAPDLAGWRRT
jgi:hypothetical protein